MKCDICGNIELFIAIKREQFEAKRMKDDSFLLINPKLLSADFYCDSEQCKDKQIRVEQIVKENECEK